MTDLYADPVTHPYIDHYDSSQPDTPHFAVDIGTPFHTQLTALLPGTVVKEDFQAWGGEIFIKPDDTSKPEYYYFHLDDFNVGPNAHVTAGDVIGLSGGQTAGGDHPVQNTASTIYSTGPHTHVGWFDGYTTPPQTGYTIPHGPDITPLLQQVQAHGIGSGRAVNVQPSAHPDPYPGGSLNPMNWPSEAQNTAQDAANNAGATIAADIANWINAKAGPFLLRIAVGSVGIGLIYLGTREVIDALKNVPETFQKQRGEYKRGEVQEREKTKKKAVRDKETEGKRAEREKQSEAKRQQREREKAARKPAAKTPEKKLTEKKPAAKKETTEKAAKKAATVEKAETVAEVAA